MRPKSPSYGIYPERSFRSVSCPFVVHNPEKDAVKTKYQGDSYFEVFGVNLIRRCSPFEGFVYLQPCLFWLVFLGVDKIFHFEFETKQRSVIGQ